MNVPGFQAISSIVVPEYFGELTIINSRGMKFKTTLNHKNPNLRKDLLWHVGNEKFSLEVSEAVINLSPSERESVNLNQYKGRRIRNRRISVGSDPLSSKPEKAYPTSSRESSCENNYQSDASVDELTTKFRSGEITSSTESLSAPTIRVRHHTSPFTPHLSVEDTTPSKSDVFKRPTDLPPRRNTQPGPPPKEHRPHQSLAASKPARGRGIQKPKNTHNPRLVALFGSDSPLNDLSKNNAVQFVKPRRTSPAGDILPLPHVHAPIQEAPEENQTRPKILIPIQKPFPNQYHLTHRDFDPVVPRAYLDPGFDPWKDAPKRRPSPIPESTSPQPSIFDDMELSSDSN